MTLLSYHFTRNLSIPFFHLLLHCLHEFPVLLLHNPSLEIVNNVPSSEFPHVLLILSRSLVVAVLLLSLLFSHEQFLVIILQFPLHNLDISLDIRQNSAAVIKLNIAYTIAAIKKFIFPIINVATKNIENIIAETKAGHLKIICSAIDITITANGKAKNINKTFISFLSFMFYYILCYFMLFG